MLVVFSGVSGVGKNTVIQKLLDKHPNMRFFKTATTRAPRPGETTYDFMSQETFDVKKMNGDFFEVECSHGFWYGTPYSALNKIIENPQNVYIKDIDVHGAAKLRNYFEDKGGMLSIFIDAPDELIRERLAGRGEPEDRIQVRLSRGAMERTYMPTYDLVVQNINLEKAVEVIEDFLIKKLGYNDDIYEK